MLSSLLDGHILHFTTIFGQYLDNFLAKFIHYSGNIKTMFWKIFGYYLVNIKMLFRQLIFLTTFLQYLDNIWEIFIQYLKTIKTIHRKYFGQYMSNIWTIIMKGYKLGMSCAKLRLASTKLPTSLSSDRLKLDTILLLESLRCQLWSTSLIK